MNDIAIIVQSDPVLDVYRQQNGVANRRSARPGSGRPYCPVSCCINKLMMMMIIMMIIKDFKTFNSYHDYFCKAELQNVCVSCECDQKL